MNETCDAATHLQQAAPLLGLLWLSALGLVLAVYWVAKDILRPPFSYTLITYDGLRALGVFGGWVMFWVTVAMLQPCVFLDEHTFLGLWFWLGLLLSALFFLGQLHRHEERMLLLDDLAHPSVRQAEEEET